MACVFKGRIDDLIIQNVEYMGIKWHASVELIAPFDFYRRLKAGKIFINKD